MRICKYIKIRLILTYAVETIAMTKKDEDRLRIVDSKITRTILGPIRTAEGKYRMKESTRK